MPQDLDAGSAEPLQSERSAGGGRAWLRPPRVLATAAGVVGAGFVLGYLVTVLAVFPSQNVAADLIRVPDLVGHTTDEAREILARAGLAYEEEAGLNHSAPVGIVVAQEPLGGQVARPASAVGVTVSLGPKLAPVPDIVGLSHAQAEIALASAGYESELVWVDAEADVGEVVDTKPAPGTPVQLPGKVQLVVSAGLPAAQVPDLVTRSLVEARATLERTGLRLGSVMQDSASLAAPGTVLRQRPAAGVVVDRATKIAVTIAVAPVPEEPGDTASEGRGGG